MAKYPQVKALFEGRLGEDRKARADLKKQLETSAGVTNATISRWVNGESRPSIEHVEAIAQVLRLDTETVRREVAPFADSRSLIDRVAENYNDRGLVLELTDEAMEIIRGFDQQADVSEVVSALDGHQAVSTLHGGESDRVDELTRVIRTVLELLRETLQTDDQLAQIADALRALDQAPQRRAR